MIFELQTTIKNKKINVRSENQLHGNKEELEFKSTHDMFVMENLEFLKVHKCK